MKIEKILCEKCKKEKADMKTDEGKVLCKTCFFEEFSSSDIKKEENKFDKNLENVCITEPDEKIDKVEKSQEVSQDGLKDKTLAKTPDQESRGSRDRADILGENPSPGTIVHENVGRNYPLDNPKTESAREESTKGLGQGDAVKHVQQDETPPESILKKQSKKIIRSEIIVKKEIPVEEEKEEIAPKEQKEKAKQPTQEYGKSRDADLFMKISVVILIVAIIAGIIWFGYNFSVYAHKSQTINTPVSNQNDNQNNFTIQNNIPTPTVAQTNNNNLNATINIINPTFIIYGNITNHS